MFCTIEGAGCFIGWNGEFSQHDWWTSSEDEGNLCTKIENFRVSGAFFQTFFCSISIAACTNCNLQIAELKKNQESHAQLLRQKQRSDDAAKHLQEEIQRMKAQRVLESNI